MTPHSLGKVATNLGTPVQITSTYTAACKIRLEATTASNTTATTRVGTADLATGRTDPGTIADLVAVDGQPRPALEIQTADETNTLNLADYWIMAPHDDTSAGVHVTYWTA